MNIIRKIKHIPQRIVFEINRYFNQKHRYDYPAENNGWRKVGNKPVFGNNNTGTMFDPFVYQDNERFIMVVSERKTGNIVRVESSDGVNWEKKETVLEGIVDSWESVVNRATIVQKEGKWYMWYTGQNGTCSKIGIAVSVDGHHYNRIQESPVLSPSDLEGISVMNPHVLWNEQKQVFQMWYAAGEDYEPDILCYAESIDGINWSNRKKVLGKEPSNRWEMAKVGGCHVILGKDGVYTIYYIGYQNVDVARICYALSPDGITWTRPQNNLVIAPTKGSWDADATYKPTVVEKDGVSYLWYNGRFKHSEFVGCAVNKT